MWAGAAAKGEVGKNKENTAEQDQEADPRPRREREVTGTPNPI